MECLTMDNLIFYNAVCTALQLTEDIFLPVRLKYDCATNKQHNLQQTNVNEEKK